MHAYSFNLWGWIIQSHMWSKRPSSIQHCHDLVLLLRRTSLSLTQPLSLASSCLLFSFPLSFLFSLLGSHSHSLCLMLRGDLLWGCCHIAPNLFPPCLLSRPPLTCSLIGWECFGLLKVWWKSSVPHSVSAVWVSRAAQSILLLWPVPTSPTPSVTVHTSHTSHLTHTYTPVPSEDMHWVRQCV